MTAAVVEMPSYEALQSQLHAMSYSEPLGVESVSLVCRLLHDLQEVTEAKDETEQKLEHAQKEALELAQRLQPLTRENAELTRENNSLYLEIIHQEEAITERERAFELELEALHDDMRKLQMMNYHKTQQCNEKEQEVAKLRTQWEQVLATGATSALPSAAMKRSATPRSLQRFSLDSHLMRNMQQQQSEELTQVTRDVHKQLAELTAENVKLQAQCDQLHAKLGDREQEIDRLSNYSVEAANNQTTSSAESQDLEEQYRTREKEEAAAVQVELLSAQINSLKDEVTRYERRLRDAAEQICRNDSITEKLQQAELDRENMEEEFRVLQSKYRILEEKNLQCGDAHREPDSFLEMCDPAPANENLAEEEEHMDVASLKKQVKTLKAHKDKLGDALRAMQYEKVSYTNALANANSHNRVLTSDLARAEASVKELTAVKANLEQSLADTRASSGTSARERDVLHESLEQSESNRTLISEEKASLDRELRSLKKILRERDDECRSLNHALLVCKREVERLTGKLDKLETAASNAGGSDEAHDDRAAVHAQEKKWLLDEQHDLRCAKEALMLRVVNLEEDLQETKTLLEEAELEKKGLTERANTALKMQSNLESMLETKKRESLDLQKQLIESKEKIRPLVDKQHQAQTLLSQAEGTEDEKLIVQNEAAALKRHVEELRDQNARLRNRVENEDLQVKRLSDQIRTLQAECAVMSKKCTTLDKEKAGLLDSYENAMVELRTARQSWNYYQNEFEKLSSEVQAQQHSLSSGEDALQSSHVSISDLKKQVQRLQSELKLKHNNLAHVETRLEQEKTTHKSVHTQLVLLQDELSQAKETNGAREIGLQQLREENQAKDRALAEKTEALDNCKLLIEQMESSRDQLVFQTKQRQQQIQRHQQEIDDLRTKITSLENENSAKVVEIASLKKLSRTLDSEKDAVNDQLDILTEKYQEIEKQSGELRQAVEAKQSDAAGLQEQMRNLVNKLNESEDKLGKMQAHCSKLENELDRLEHLKGVHTAELTALAQDLENMTIENQAIAEECTRLQRMEHSRSQSAKSMKHSTREIERQRDTLQIELEDLRHTYRSLIQEQEGMQKARAEMLALQDELASVNESLRKQVAAFDNQLRTLREKNATLTTEATTYRDQVSFLTEKLQKSEEKHDDLQTRMQQLVQELDTQKQISTEISAQRYGAQAENATVSQRIVHLEAKLSNCKYEVQSLQAKLRDEQSQRRSLEEVASTLRQKIATNENVILHLEEQRNAMAQEIQASYLRQVPVSTAIMDMSELNHAPPSVGQASHMLRSKAPGATRDRLTPPPISPNATGSTPESGEKSSSASSSLLPYHAIEKAQMKCQELEDRLAQQDDTIKESLYESFLTSLARALMTIWYLSAATGEIALQVQAVCSKVRARNPAARSKNRGVAEQLSCVFVRLPRCAIIKV
uniref:Nucleoprotein TPR n=1 Tax=Peronospora matthiolae TaxID=2874970 RepID=A0AAV1U9X8_9STRA